MPTAPPIFWIFQFLILLLWGTIWFVAPGLSLQVLIGDFETELTKPAIDQLRMSAPYLLGLGGFSLFAMMTRRTRIMRGMAGSFAFAFGLWSLAYFQGVAEGHYGVGALVLGLVPVLLAIGNLALAIPKSASWVRDEDAGDSTTRPASAFVLWVLQVGILGGGAAVFFVAPEFVLSLIAEVPADVVPACRSASGFSCVAIHQTQLLGALSLGMGCISFLAIYTHSAFAWRGFAFFFMSFFLVWALSISLILIFGDYKQPVLQVLVPGIAFGIGNYLVFMMRGEFDPGDVQRFNNAWTPLDLWAGPLMAWSVLRTGRRSSHLVGVGAAGHFHPSPALCNPEGEAPEDEASPQQEVPSNAFFTRVQRPVQVRFANLTQLDDASLDVRGCGIKFSKHAIDSEFDLVMNTGSFCPADSIVAFAKFVLSKFLPQKLVEKGTRANPIAREGGVAGLRRAPDSYSALKYYGQLVRHWSDLEGRRHLVRYRVIPDQEATPQESGLPSLADAGQIWCRERAPSETRPSDYLRQELKERLAEGPIRLRLQAQFHQLAPGDSQEWYNPAVDWDEATHPWRTLGDLVLDRALSDEECEVLQICPANHPECLGVPSSTGPFGYTSLAESEVRVVGTLSRLRAWMYGRKGLPQFGRVTPS